MESIEALVDYSFYTYGLSKSSIWQNIKLLMNSVVSSYGFSTGLNSLDLCLLNYPSMISAF